MKRREFMGYSAGLGVVAAASTLPGTLLAAADFKSNPTDSEVSNHVRSSETARRLKPPAKGKIPVAFTISQGVTVIDFAGPWEVFQDVMVRERGQSHEDQMPFQLYTVSETSEPLTGSGGLKLVPDYTFQTAPAPKVVVVPAQRGGKALHEWLHKVSDSADVIMSVCTGAFQLGRAGLLSGKTATTHHDFFEQFAKAFPDVTVKRGLRFVEHEKISTAGGLSSGIDLALRVVDRYFGRNVAEATAFYMEYQSKGWIV